MHLSPNNIFYTEKEKALIRAFKGKQKQNQAKLESNAFFGPAYPQLAKHAWLKPNVSVLSRVLFLNGPIVNFIATTKNTEEQAKKISDCIVTALLGDTDKTPREKIDFCARFDTKRNHSITFMQEVLNGDELLDHSITNTSGAKAKIISVNVENNKEVILQDLEGQFKKGEAVFVDGKEIGIVKAFNYQRTKEEASQHVADYLLKNIGLVEHLLAGKNGNGTKKKKSDEMSEVMTKDFIAILKLEPFLSRHHWIALLMAYLRTSICMWYTSKCQPTNKLIFWINNALEGKVPQQQDVENFFIKSNPCLISCSNRITRGLDPMLIEYGKNRVKLSIWIQLLKDFEIISNESFNNGKLTVTDPVHGEDMKIHDLLIKIKNNSEFIKTKLGESGIDSSLQLSRESEKYRLYKNPLSYGQTKQARFMMYVLRKSEGFDERSSHILEATRDKENRVSFVIAPGQLLLQLIVLLADLELRAKKIKRRLILRDIEDHFSRYGIDFRNEPDGRDLLIDRLGKAGLLRGSPDAKDSVQVINPYKKIIKAKDFENPYKESFWQ